VKVELTVIHVRWLRVKQNKWVALAARASLHQIFVDRGSLAFTPEEAMELARSFEGRNSPDSSQIYQLFRNWAYKAKRASDVHVARPVTVHSVHKFSTIMPFYF